MSREQQGVEERAFPIIQRPRPQAGDPVSVPWSLAEQAYEVYSHCYGTEQSLERLAERGGFGVIEIRVFLRVRKEPKENWCELTRKAWLGTV